MATLQEILARAQALREETALGSISPERAGSIMYDTLQQINQMQLAGGSLVISKIYASVSAMEADDAPVSDLTGQALRQGQLVVIVPSDTSSSDLGSVYRYNGTTGGASSWSFTGKIGGYPMDQTPTQGSTRAVTSGGVYEQITQLGQDPNAKLVLSFIGQTGVDLKFPLIIGRKYRLWLTAWDTSSVTGNKFSISYSDTLNGTYTDLASWSNLSNLPAYYDIQAGHAFYRIWGRGNSGESCNIVIEDITIEAGLSQDIEEITRTLEDVAYSKTNLPSVIGRWVNNGGVVDTATSGTLFRFDPIAISPGQTFDYTLALAGAAGDGLLIADSEDNVLETTRVYSQTLIAPTNAAKLYFTSTKDAFSCIVKGLKTEFESLKELARERFNGEITLRNGSNGNPSNTNAVCSEYVPTNGAQYITINTTRPNRDNCVYYFGFALTSSQDDIGTTRQNSQMSGYVGQVEYSQNLGNRLIDISAYRTAIGISFTIVEYNTATSQYIALRTTDFDGYAISVDTIYANDIINTARENVETNRYARKEGALLQACRYHNSSATSKDLQFELITDIHTDSIAMNNASDIADSFATIDAIMCLGDITGSQYWEVFRNTFANMVGSSLKPYFVCLGNHDVGNANYVGYCPTHQQEYDTFIKPMVDAGFLATGEYTAGLSYYYHDFAEQGIRLIVLNEYDEPLGAGSFNETYWKAVTYNSSYPNVAVSTSYSVGAHVNAANYTEYSFECVQAVTTPSSFYTTPAMFPSYKIRRGYRVIRQTQAQWFLNTLVSTPAGYGVVVALHNPVSEDCANQRTLKFAQDIQYLGSNGIQNYMETDFIADAVNAFVNGSSYSANIVMKGEAAYLNTQGGGTYAYSVSKNFSAKNTGVKFLCYLGGHCHRDLIFKHDTYLQYQIAPICATTQWANNAGNDIKRTDADGYGKDCLTIISFAKDTQSVRLVKVGVDVTTAMDMRDQELLNLTE